MIYHKTELSSVMQMTERDSSLMFSDPTGAQNNKTDIRQAKWYLRRRAERRQPCPLEATGPPGLISALSNQLTSHMAAAFHLQMLTCPCLFLFFL